MKKLIPVAVTLVLLGMPFASSLAATNPANMNVWNPAILKGPLITCTGTGAGGFPPCQNLCDFVTTFINVVYYFIGVVLWVLTPIMFAWAGLSLALSQGSSEARSAAKNRMLRVVYGILITVCAYLIVATFVAVLNISGVGGFSNPTCVVLP